MGNTTPQSVQAAYAALLQKGLSRRSVEQTPLCAMPAGLTIAS